MSKIGNHFIEVEARRKRSGVLHVILVTKHIASASAEKEKKDSDEIEYSTHFAILIFFARVAVVGGTIRLDTILIRMSPLSFWLFGGG